MGTTSPGRRSRTGATPVLFDAVAFDKAMEARGIGEEGARAAELGVHRATLNRWRRLTADGTGLWLSLGDALHHAQRVGMPVDQLFVPVAVKPTRPLKAAA